MNQWTIVRIFVSSTFKDMDVERDALRNIVVPRLNEFFIGQRTNVQLVDLRHSVETDPKLTPEEREERVYSVCMDEIEACQPFFLGLVGHRYGWIPKDFEATKSVKLPDDFPLESNQLSVTVCEFLHALFGKNTSNRAIVMLRDEKSYANLSESEKKNYMDDGENGSYVRTFRDYLLKHKQELSVDAPYCLNVLESGGSEIEAWCNHIYKKLRSLISQHIGNPETLAEDNFIKAQRDYVNRQLVKFVGREDVIGECIRSIEERQALYIFEPEHGMGQTALLCKLYSLLSEDNRYFCLFNSQEASVDASHYHQVFYYWNLQMLRFLGRDSEYLKAMKDNAKLLFEEYCRLTQAIFEEKHVRVAVFQEHPYDMDEFYSLKQAFNLYVQTIPTEHKDAAKIVMPYVLRNLTDNDFNAITQGLRKGILQDLRAKKQALNVKWLSMAVNILTNLNKLDYQDIRSKDGIGDSERNINFHLCRIIGEMPDNYEDLSYYWIKRLENVLGKDFVATYIGMIGVSRGLTEEDMAQLTGRDVDWCAYFKHILGNSIIKEDSNGYLTLKNEIVGKVIENWTLAYRKELCQQLNKYIQQLPPTSPTHQRNIFIVAMGCEDYQTCLEYIAKKENYQFYWGLSEAMMAFDQKAKFHQDEYVNMVLEMVNMAPLEYDSFHGLNQWCYIAKRRHDYTLYLRTAQFMISRLEEAKANGILSDDAALALAEIYDSCGNAYVELPDGEESWNESNQKQLKLCTGHFNKSLEWNARLMRAIYDRFEGFGNIHERWLYLNDVFVPLELKGVLYDNSLKFDGYFRLLREVAILMARFEKGSDPGPYAMKAYQMAKALKDRQIQHPDAEFSNDDIILEWILCAWQIYRLAPYIKSINKDQMNGLVENVIDEMKQHIERFFCFKSYAVVYAQLTAEYAMAKCHTDAQNAMKMIDHLIDDIIVNDTPDDAFDFQISEKDISFMSRMTIFMKMNNKVDYSDISLAWALVARHYIRMTALEEVKSAYTEMGNEMENVMRLSEARIENIWDRQLDSNTVLLSANYVRLLEESQKGFPDKSVALKLFDDYQKLFKEAVVHYRYINFIQNDHVQQLREKLKEITSNRTNLSQEELEQLIDEESYDQIIQQLCCMENGSKEEFYYLGLAYLRNNQFDDALELYQMLLGIKNLPGGFYFSCITNYLISLLAANKRKAFFHIYQQLDSQVQQDSDIELLYRAYSDSINRYDGKIILPIPYGYKL